MLLSALLILKIRSFLRIIDPSENEDLVEIYKDLRRAAWMCFFDGLIGVVLIIPNIYEALANIFVSYGKKYEKNRFLAL